MERKFDNDLTSLKEKLLRMASLAEETISLAIKSLKDRNESLIPKVFKIEKEVNRLDVEIDQACMSLLALQQPMAGDLRFITSVMKSSVELERISDLSINIVERTLVLLKSPVLKPLIDIPHMAAVAQNMVTFAIDAFVRKDDELAREVCRRDDEVDDLYDQIFRELLTYMMQDTANITRAVDLLLIARHLERIADHATNIGEDVIYYVKGKTIKHHYESGEM